MDKSKRENPNKFYISVPYKNNSLIIYMTRDKEIFLKYLEKITDLAIIYDINFESGYKNYNKLFDMKSKYRAVQYTPKASVLDEFINLTNGSQKELYELKELNKYK